MAWDSSRPIPWKKLGVYLLLYAAIVLAFFMITKPGRVGSALPGLALGVVLAGAFMIVLFKMGWNMPMFRSREENEALRAQRQAQKAGGRSTGSGGSSSGDAHAGPRPKPAPTSRTSTGPSQHPRRTTKTRKR